MDMDVDCCVEPCSPCGDDDLSVSLCVENLCLSYSSKIALENISLDIHTKSVTAIIGPSGSGKSSFLGCLNRMTDLNKCCDVGGEVRFDNVDIFKGLSNDLINLRLQIGMVFQKPNPFPFSIKKNLTLPLKHHGIRNKDELDRRVETALRQVNLWDEVKDRLGQSALALSGGQQQRLCMARALVLEPNILLMDEPCSSLDPISTKHIEELLHELKKKYTIVIVTHDLAQARRVADFVALFWSVDGAGKLIEHGSAKRLFDDPSHDLTRKYLSGQL